MKYLIVNADDFGYSELYNKKILELIESGAVTSTTVLVNRITSNQSGQIKKLIEFSKKMNVSVGLHSDFLSKDYERQLKSQFDKFIDTFGFKPSHIDIHKPQADSYLFVSEFCKNHNIPFRNHGVFSKGVKTTSEPVFNGTVPDFGVIENYLKSLKSGFYEILFHPGIFDPSSKSSLNKEREVDAKHVIMLNSILGKYKIKLASFLDLSKC